MKTIVIATLLTIALIFSCACAIPATAEEANPLTVVIGTAYEGGDLWRIDCLANDGNIWSFYADCAEWEQGDLARLYMWHDEVIDVEWVGYIDLGCLLYCLCGE